MIIRTYQSQKVLEALKHGQVHRARKNLRFAPAYTALVELFQLHCVSPVFGYIKGRRYCTDGKVSDSVLLTLKVPDDRVYLTEYSVWADYMYCIMHYTRPGYRTRLLPNEEYTQRQFNHMQHDLLTQRPLETYHIPQAVFEEIRPEWLVKVARHENILHRLFNRLQEPSLFRGI